MDIIFFIIMIGLFVFISVKNFSLIKREKHNKKYITCYQNVLHNKENCKHDLDLYIESEESEEYKNKAKIIKLYYELANCVDYKDTINDISFIAMYYKNGNIDNSLLKLNSDSFIFSMLCLVKAYEQNEKDAIEMFCTKLCEHHELETTLEYQEVIALANALLNKEDKGSAMLHSLLDGTYTDYSYDKNMIGLYKRIAAATLIFNMEDVDEYFRNDLHNFADTFIGECFLKGLGLFEIYKVVEENDNNQEIQEKEETTQK